MENVQIKIGIIGLGRMGRFYLDEMKREVGYCVYL